MDDSRPPLPGQSEDHDENQQRNSGQSIGHADQLRRLQCRQSLSAAGDGSDGRLGGAPKNRDWTECQPDWLGPRVGSRYLRLDRSHQHDPLLADRDPGIHRRNNQLLGEYFGSKKQGWPFYNIPNPTNDPDAPIKIPSGANIFAQSPIKNVPFQLRQRTVAERQIHALERRHRTDRGHHRVGGRQSGSKGSTILHLTRAEPNKIDFIAKDYLVVGVPPGHPPTLPNPIQEGTTVTDVDKTAGTVTLSKALLPPSKDCAFTFKRPVHDYASEAMIKLWYSWAQYYLAHWKDKTPGAPTARCRSADPSRRMAATLTFNEAHHELVQGMAVTGPGLDDAETEKGRHQGDAVILQIASDKKSVILSQVVNTASTNAPFTFRPPKSLLCTPTAEGDPGYPLIGDKFEFSNEPPWHDPYEFSQQVYLIMASMNQIGHPNNDSVSKYMQDIVGANMGFIFTDAAKQSFDGKMVTSMIRDMIKSVLRGVSDFTKYPDKIERRQTRCLVSESVTQARQTGLQCLQPRSLRLVRPCKVGLLGLRVLRG